MRWIVLILFALSACTPVYLPGARNVPVFENKGEVQLSAYAGLTGGPGDVDGNFQVAWAPIKYLALTGNFLYVNHNEEGYARYHKVTDIAIGFYKPDRIYFDCFLGYGEGKARDYSGTFFGADIYAAGTYQRLSIQPTIALREKNFSFAYTSRFSWIDFKTYESDRYQGQSLNAKLIIEPCITARMLLFKSVYPSMQFGFNFHLQSEPFFEYQPMHIAVGVSWKPSDLWQK
jgi:hypothetical protein